jgi:hypothetical protein
VDALFVVGQAENFTHRRLIIELAERSRLPAIYFQTECVELGGLMAYSLDWWTPPCCQRRKSNYIPE